MKFSKYQYVNTLELIGSLDKYLMDGDNPKYEYIAYDTETNGLKYYKNSIVGFSLSVNSKEGFYIPLVEWIPDEASQKIKTINKVKKSVFEKGHFKCVWTGKIYPEFFTPYDYEMPPFIPAIIHRWLSKCKLIMHNAPFDVIHTWIMTGVDLKDALFLDTALLSHIINENSFNGLKETATEWKDELGINPYQLANQEQKELTESVCKNGGKITKGGKAKTIWRADPLFMCKYASADTFLTYGLFEVGLKKFIQDFGKEKLDWLFVDEVMPVCKEVVIPMKRNGVYINVEHFKTAALETKKLLLDLEDDIISTLGNDLNDFSIGKSLDEAISNQRLIKKIIELEGLTIPTKYDKKTDKYKETLAKGEVKKVYQENPHWLWGYIIGEDEIKYSDEKIEKIKKDLYLEVEGRRYRFNIGSPNHLRWLFCDKYGMDKSSLPQTDSATSDNPIPSMGAETLKDFMLKDHPWVKKLITYKKLLKLYSTYMMPAIELNINGILYMDMKQNGTVSGRFACSGGFNLQTLPRIDDEIEMLGTCDKCNSENVTINQKFMALADRMCNDCGHVEEDIVCASVIKEGFIAPPGYKIVNADYSSLEPRCFAYQSGDEELKRVYLEGLDLYSKVYCDVFDEEKKYSANPDAENFLKKLNKPARTFVKPIVLGIPYGANDYQVATLIGKTITIKRDDGTSYEIPDKAAGCDVIQKYLNAYPNLRKYMEEQEINCLTKGYVEALCGRRRHFQYAPKIYRFLLLKRLQTSDLIDATSSQLKKSNSIYISSTGNKVTLTDTELKSLIKDLGLPYQNCMAKGYWLYVKNLLKADLNNAKNFPIQALAGHITNRGMLDTTRFYNQNNIDGWVFLQVHDEISCYVKTEQSEQGSNYLKIGMEDNKFAKLIDVPMIADPIICDNIKEAK